jgi:hypothetical protein
MTVEPRDCLYGGVCEAFRLSVRITPEEAREGCGIDLYDVVSMYPSVQYENPFFDTLHPEILDHRQLPGWGRDWGAKELRRFSPSICSIWILPPEEELYPCLPARIRGKTIYTLCHACAEENRQDVECSHADPRDRALIGTYTSVDLELALEWGYRLIQVFQVWTWRGAERRESVFKDYVTALTEIKVKSSGWPSGSDEADRQAYLTEWRRQMKFPLPAEEVESNPPACTTAKLLLNSLWGKLW